MSYNQDGNIGSSNNFGKNLDLAALMGPITKKMSQSFQLKKPVTFHHFSNLYLYIKETIWIGGIVFDLVATIWSVHD